MAGAGGLAGSGVPRDSLHDRHHALLPRPRPERRGDRRPSAQEQALCRPFWQRELELAQPEVIITLGTMALHALGFRGARLQDAVGNVMMYS